MRRFNAYWLARPWWQFALSTAGGGFLLYLVITLIGGVELGEAVGGGIAVGAAAFIGVAIGWPLRRTRERRRR